MLPKATRARAIEDVSIALGVYDVDAHNATHDARLAVRGLFDQGAMIDQNTPRVSPLVDSTLPPPGNTKKRKRLQPSSKAQPSVAPSQPLPVHPPQQPLNLPTSLQAPRPSSLTPGPPPPSALPQQSPSLSPPRKKIAEDEDSQLQKGASGTVWGKKRLRQRGYREA